jgi:hypothetical protein
VILDYTVYMDRRDVTPWVQSLEIRQPAGEIYREFRITFAGWSAVENYQSGVVWDIYSSMDAANPRGEIEIRAGIVPPDRERQVMIRPGEMPEISIDGFDHVWLAQRRRPSDTIVIVPGSGYGEGPDGVQYALSRYDGPLGRYVVWQYVSTIHRAIQRLCSEAGMNVDCRFPNQPIVPFVVDPTYSYWEAVKELFAPWGAEAYYRRTTNTVILVDPEAPRYLVGNTLELATKHIVSAEALPIRTRRIRRVIVRIT